MFLILFRDHSRSDRGIRWIQFSIDQVIQSSLSCFIQVDELYICAVNTTNHARDGDIPRAGQWKNVN